MDLLKSVISKKKKELQQKKINQIDIERKQRN